MPKQSISELDNALKEKVEEFKKKLVELCTKYDVSLIGYNPQPPQVLIVPNKKV